MKVLLKFECDYADEFDVVGTRICPIDEWNSFKEDVKEVDFPKEFYFGTNEVITIDSYSEILNSIKVVEISEQEETFLKKSGLDSFGFFPDWCEILD